MAIYNGTKVLSVVKTEGVLVDSASEVSYDNNESGLEATSVQGAIDELDEKIILGKNLYDNSKALTNGFLNSDGTITDESSVYITTDYVFIKAGTYTISFGVIKYAMRIIANFYSNVKVVDNNVGSYINQSGLFSLTFTLNKNGYVRFCFDGNSVVDTKKIQIEKGITATHFENYYVKLNNDKTFIEYFENNGNLVDITKSVVGFLYEGGNVEPSGTSYKTTEYIPIQNGKTYTIKGVARFILITDITSQNRQLLSSQENYSFTAMYDGYIAYSFYATDEATTMLVEGTDISHYIPYGFKPKKDIYPNDNFTNTRTFISVLSNKKYVACGDSFTEGGYNESDGFDESVYKYQEGDYAGKQITYPYILGIRNNMVVVNEAVSGSCLAYFEGANENSCFSISRYKNIPTDADYITLKFGINDSHSNIPIGTIGDSDNTTFYGAWNVVMSYLIENHPYAKIGIIISNGCDTNDYPNATREIAKKYGIPYLDEVEGEQVPLLIRSNRAGVPSSIQTIRNQAFRVSETNLHPNVKAQEYESSIVEAFLKRL